MDHVFCVQFEPLPEGTLLDTTAIENNWQDVEKIRQRRSRSFVMLTYDKVRSARQALRPYWT